MVSKLLSQLLVLIVAVGLLGASACRNLDAEGYLCGVRQECPPGYQCSPVDGRCHKGAVLSDGGPRDADAQDGAKDADLGRDGGPDRSADVKPGDGGLDGSSDLAPEVGSDLGRDAGGPQDVVSEAGTGIGQACGAGAPCPNGLSCRDGVCCSTACTGSCEACAQVYTNQPDGTCAPVLAGRNAHPSTDCPMADPTSCGNNGSCDGERGCQKYGSSQTCGASLCAGAAGAQSFQPASTCDGTGKCAKPAAISCKQFDCSPTSGCALPCTTSTDCGTGSYCDAPLCKAKKVNGAGCASQAECLSGLCVDNVCCKGDCTKSKCTSCNMLDTGQPSGECAPVQKGKKSPRAGDCAAGTPTECGADGTCDGAGACALFGPNTMCAAASCSGSLFTAAASCNGKGACGQGATTNCGQLLCTTGGCGKTCTLDTDCDGTSYCSGTTCTLKKMDGATCQKSSECKNKYCVDGVCCGSQCATTCYGCSSARTNVPDGMCAPLIPGTKVSGCAAESQATCGLDGACDGNGQCRKWAKGTACQGGMCDASGNYVPAVACDGFGTCPKPQAMSCSPYACAATGCVINCSSTSPCLGDNYCDSTSHCAAKKTNGSACASSAECLNGSCTEGVCCDGPCTGGCQSCKRALNGQADGTCAAISAGGNARSGCPVDPSNMCGLTGKCDGLGKCAITQEGTSCDPGKICTAQSCKPRPECPASPTTPYIDCPCAGGPLGCQGPAQRLRLVCSNGVWSSNGTCGGTDLCDTSTGSCAPIIPGCSGRQPGYKFCTGTDVLNTCGPDLVTVSQLTCAGLCTAGACATPRCGDGKVETGEACDDGNVSPDDGCDSDCSVSAVVSVSSGISHTCALLSSGNVRCWGDNSSGQLGQDASTSFGTTLPYLIPAVTFGAKATALASGLNHNCVILANGSVRCWGANDQGQLGQGDVTARTGPAPAITFASPAKAIAAGGATTCVVLQNGDVRCWGNNGPGLLGLGVTTSPSQTMAATALGPVALGGAASSIAVGSNSVCAIKAGGVICWGSNGSGQLGRGDTMAIGDNETPAAAAPPAVPIVPTGRTAVQLATGGSHTCARLDDGELECWGPNTSFQLGLGLDATTVLAIGDNEAPATSGINQLLNVTAVFTGNSNSTCARINSGGLRCWGQNTKGQLGYGDITNKGGDATTKPSALPDVSFGTGVTASVVALGPAHACALLSNGQVRCWGRDNAGQLGDGTILAGTNDYVATTPSLRPQVAIFRP